LDSQCVYKKIASDRQNDRHCDITKGSYALEAKEAECFECKIECDRSDEIITGLGKDKFELENKVRQLKSERKRMETQIKETEDQVHEIERTYKEKLEENNEEIRKMKVNFEKLGQQIKLPKLINFGIKDG
jgi:peptidoglycan hydrolase CwlO-like protein